MTARLRFAPSPSGLLHQGNGRTAVWNWLYSRVLCGLFLLRIEDTDKARSSSENEAAILEDLEWLGISPDKPLTRQSENSADHIKAVEELKSAGKVYPCFCSAELLAAQRKEDLAVGKAPRYRGTCRVIPKADAWVRAENEPHALRFAVDPGAQIVVDDLVRGQVRFSSTDLGDFIVRRNDGAFSFFLANIIDDMRDAITHVLRGEDHLSNTPRQILIARSLGGEAPKYGHLGLVIGPGRELLSKRDQSMSLKAHRAAGYTAEVIFDMLARCGLDPRNNDILDKETWIKVFDIDRISPGPSVFDLERLNNRNRKFIQSLSSDQLADRLAPLYADISPALAELVRFEETTLVELAAAARSINESPDPDGEAYESLQSDEGRTALQAWERALSECDGSDFNSVAKKAASLSMLSGKRLYFPLRAALMGKLSGPHLEPLFEFLGQEKSLLRIRRYLKSAAS